MKKEELKSKIEEIRQLLIKSDLDEATKKLTALATHFGDDAYDEAVTINANWNELERKIRSALIHDQDARIRQNQLIDQILDFSRELEDYKKPQPASTGKTWMYVLGGLLILAILGFFAQSLLSGPSELKEAKEELEPITIPPKQADVPPATKPSQSPKEYNAPSSSRTTPAPKKETPAQEPVASDATPASKTEQVAQESTDSSPDLQAYERFYIDGVKAYNRKDYEKAYELLQSASAIQKTQEAKDYINLLNEELYKKYRTKGMDYFNAKDYAMAKKTFQKAQGFKNTVQARGMIQKCDKQLRLQQ